MILDFSLPSLPSFEGGQAYALALIDALRALGHEVSLGASSRAEAVRVIDGHCLPRLEDVRVEGAIGLIHHVTALATAAERDLLRARERERLPLLARVIATSEVTAARLRDEFGVAAERLRIVRPGVPLLPRARGSEGGPCAILSIGALVPRHGHDRLIRALARLPDLDWHLTIVGDDQRDAEYAAAVSGLAATLPVGGRVEIRPHIDAASLEALWHGCDIYAQFATTQSEPASIAMALRRGIPVATTCGSASVPDDAGATGQPDDLVGMSKFLRRMIFDVGLRKHMADAAWKAGQALPDWKSQAEAFVAALA